MSAVLITKHNLKNVHFPVKRYIILCFWIKGKELHYERDLR